MNLNIETKASLIMTAIQEDRAELRSIKDRIYGLTTLITTASFAVTAFALKDKPELLFNPFLTSIDIAFTLMLWIVFWRLKVDLDICRLCLEARESMLRHLGSDDRPFDVFGEVQMKTPKIVENGMYWLVAMASAAMLLKAIVIQHSIHCT